MNTVFLSVYIFDFFHQGCVEFSVQIFHIFLDLYLFHVFGSVINSTLKISVSYC